MLITLISTLPKLLKDIHYLEKSCVSLRRNVFNEKTGCNGLGEISVILCDYLGTKGHGVVSDHRFRSSTIFPSLALGHATTSSVFSGQKSQQSEGNLRLGLVVGVDERPELLDDLVRLRLMDSVTSPLIRGLVGESQSFHHVLHRVHAETVDAQVQPEPQYVLPSSGKSGRYILELQNEK